MSAHDQCYRPGRYNCEHDEQLETRFSEVGTGQGSIEAPTGWFAEFTLMPDIEQGLIEHYGSRWAILRESSQGFFWGEFFDTEAARDERLNALEAAWLAWDTEEVL